MFINVTANGCGHTKENNINKIYTIYSNTRLQVHEIED